MTDLNKVLLIGRVDGPPEFDNDAIDGNKLRMCVTTKGSTPVNEDGTGGDAFIVNHVVYVRGGLAKKCAAHVKDGQLLYIEGSVRESSTGAKVILASTVTFLGGDKSADG